MIVVKGVMDGFSSSFSSAHVPFRMMFLVLVDAQLENYYIASLIDGVAFHCPTKTSLSLSTFLSLKAISDYDEDARDCLRCGFCSALAAFGVW